MGIDIEGGMIVGRLGKDMQSCSGDMSLYEWAVEENEMDSFSMYYDAGEDYQYFGFEVKDVNVDDIEGEWLEDVKEKSKRFKDLTGLDAKLIGSQNVW